MDLLQGAFEDLVQQLMAHDFAVRDHFLSEELTASLWVNLQIHLDRNEMKKAGVGKQQLHQLNTDIRRDLICWIEDSSKDPAEKELLHHIRSFIQYLNETCYTGIRNFECHYAWYDKGSFYKKHLDQFKSDQGRKFSLVIYLNENWDERDGGELVLYLPSGRTSILPVGGRAVFFKSDLIEHEVLESFRPRMSIAGWLKNV